MIRGSLFSSYLSEGQTKTLEVNEFQSKIEDSISPELITKINNCLNQIEEFDFNIFELDNIVERNSLFYVADEIFSLLYFYDDLIPQAIFKEFITVITQGYSRDVPYHNDLHACDVLQTTYVIMEKGSIYYRCSLTELDYISILLSAICHDYKHPGIGNSYLINSSHPIALNFNDYSPLENYHVSEAFKVIIRKEYNIFAKFNPAEFRLIRKRMIESILSTDMTNHSKNLTALKNKLAVAGITSNSTDDISKIIEDADNSKRFDNQQLIINNIIHAADISNPVKLSHIYKKWVDLVFNEFYHQGDLEKKENLTVSLLCDRSLTDINKSQIGFIKFVVKPTYETISIISPEIHTYIEYMNKNQKMFEDLTRADEKKA